jgi:hypothetical protein
MSTDTLLVECLTSAGVSPRQAAAFERWIEDQHPVGIGVSILETAITRQLLRDTKKYVVALETQARHNRELEEECSRLRSAVNEELFR